MLLQQPLKAGAYYHIYNRGNNHENIFIEERNYRYFLTLYTQHIHPIADTFAYCLLKNHFHILLRIKPELAQTNIDKHSPIQAFSNLFNAYTKAINKAYGRTGKLFQEHFKRIEVTNQHYFANLIFYIHFNPQKHGFVNDFRVWPWSSYSAYISSLPSKVMRDEALQFFGDRQAFTAFHQGVVAEKFIASVILEDDLR